MDPESGAAPAGSFISLSEQEQRYFSGLHGRCQADPAGTLSSAKVAELLKASQLPPEALRQVTELCGAKRLGYFGTPQFFVALKLVAAAQSGLPVHLESLSANLPLPRFVGLKNEPELPHTVAPPSIEGQGGTAGSAPWTSADRITCRHLEANADKKDTRSPPRSPCCSPPHSPLTYRGRPYAKQRKGADAQNAYESKYPSWSMVQPDQHGSPGNYRTKAAAAMEHPALARTSSAERLDQQGPVDYADEDPWRITEEQLEYYTNQFKSLQPDLGALILGTIAKNFFTKSKLPIPELSHIWELSDVDRDGALTFPEFCTAFHLIVARKNGYVLPECLPPRLRPGFALPEETGKTDVKKETMTQQKRTLRLGAFTERPEPLPQDLDPNMRTKTRPRSYSSTSVEDAMKKAEEPPTPPPRPQKTHSRASSLDLNKLFQQGAPGLKSGWLPPPPALPPRPTTAQVPHFINVSEKKVQQPNFADFSHFREEEESMKPEEEPGPRTNFGPSNEDPGAIGVSHSQVPQKPVRRKYHPESQNPEATPPPAMPYSTPTKAAPKLPSKQKRAIQTAIRKNKESNAVLTRLNSELQQQLKVVHQERVTLEVQLDLLRPLAST